MRRYSFIERTKNAEHISLVLTVTTPESAAAAFSLRDAIKVNDKACSVLIVGKLSEYKLANFEQPDVCFFFRITT